MLHFVNEQLFEKGFENDKERLVKTIGLVLNSELYDPEVSNPGEPNRGDPLVFDIWESYQNVLGTLERDIEGQQMNEGFLRILGNYKNNLKGLETIFRTIDSDRIEFRKISILLLKKILGWQKNLNFYEDSSVKQLSTKLISVNYEIVKKPKIISKIGMQFGQKILKILRKS